MKRENKKPTEICCVEELFKYYIFGCGDVLYISNCISPTSVELFLELVDINLKVIYFDYREYDLEFSQTHEKNGLVPYILNKKHVIYKQTYKYKSKNKIKYMTTLITDYIDKYCNYTREIKEQGLAHSKIHYASYGSKTELINEQFGLNISRQSTYLHEKEQSQIYIHKKEKELFKKIKKLNIQPSGYYNYDEEFIKISKKIYVRLTLIDAHTKVIINDELIPKIDFNKEYIEKFLNDSTTGIKLNTIITDGNRSYPEIIERLGAKHHICTFHLMHNLMQKLNPYINRRQNNIKRLKESNKKKTEQIEKLKAEIPHKRGRPKKSDTTTIKNLEKRKKLKNEIDQNNEKIRKNKAEIKEHIEYKKKIQKIFKAKTLKTAMKTLQRITRQIRRITKNNTKFHQITLKKN